MLIILVNPRYRSSTPRCVISSVSLCFHRQMILTGCVAFAKHVGPTRVEAELLPQCWEQVQHLQCRWPLLLNMLSLVLLGDRKTSSATPAPK